MPLALFAVVYAVIKVLAKLITGVATAGIVYYFLSTVAKPRMDALEQELVNKVGELSTVGGTAAQCIQYLDLGHCVVLILSASTVCFTLKIMSVAVRAFGINTG